MQDTFVPACTINRRATLSAKWTNSLFWNFSVYKSSHFAINSKPRIKDAKGNVMIINAMIVITHGIKNTTHHFKSPPLALMIARRSVSNNGNAPVMQRVKRSSIICLQPNARIARGILELIEPCVCKHSFHTG